MAAVMQTDRYAEDPALAEAWDEALAREEREAEADRRMCFCEDVFEAMCEGEEPLARKLADLIAQAAREQADPDYETAEKRVLAVSMLDSILGAVREEMCARLAKAEAA